MGYVGCLGIVWVMVVAIDGGSHLVFCISGWGVRTSEFFVLSCRVASVQVSLRWDSD